MSGEGGGGGGGYWWNQLSTFDAEFKFAKIQISYVWLGGRGWWYQLPTFDAEFKFAKIQNSYVRCEGGGGGGWWNQLSTFDADADSNFFAKNFLSFRAKIGTDLFWTLSTKWFATLRIANHKYPIFKNRLLKQRTEVENGKQRR